MNMTAICINCGAKKSLPYEKCSQCGFDPQLNQDDLVKSVYLSSGRFDFETEKRDYYTELQSYAERIRLGLNVDYDPSEIERLRIQLAEVEAFGDKSVLRYLFKVFLPGILFVLVVVGVLIALRQL